MGMLQALREEQALLNEYSHAPYFDLLRELGEDGDTVEEVLRRQIFNWLPGGAPEHKCLELISKLSRTDVGILWNCTMKEQDVVQVHASWDSAQLRVTDVEELLEQLMNLIGRLARSENWDMTIQDLRFP